MNINYIVKVYIHLFKNLQKKRCKYYEKKSELQLSEMIIKKYNLIDRRDTRIYTIDPKSCKDYDDAFGIQKKMTRLLLVFILPMYRYG